MSIKIVIVSVELVNLLFNQKWFLIKGRKFLLESSWRLLAKAYKKKPAELKINKLIEWPLKALFMRDALRGWINNIMKKDKNLNLIGRSYWLKSSIISI